MITLTALQSRVIGVMLEKESTTPEQYPLSLNALTNGCNQKSNREPVMSLSETEVQNILDELIDMKQLMVDSGASGRVNKYKHRFCNTSFGSLQLTEQQKSIICVLFLRGPQTPGELRTRTNRLADFANVNEVEAALEQLQNLNNVQLVKKLAREPGKRESRYIHLFSDTSGAESAPIEAEANSAPVSSADQSELETRVELLELEVNELKAELARLSALVE
ncbi:YceH family protein [Psychromonas ossibalaenae]|uniref:YceH family protein n=1 Tax=Psychromonas ossibalaenae TaxID=444922 RepID=UPI000378B1C2|nr:YceH family protein [Psychromonas ossibalaenae]